MQEKSVASWEQFLYEVRLLDAQRATLRREAEGLHVSDLLFRGQADARWSLSTTLERAQGASLEVGDYYHTISAIKTEVESFTGREWSMMSPFEYETKHLPARPRPPFFPQDAYEFMVYLRHHGFPSPLLDWTTSPFIAAFFAFRAAPPDSEVAVFVYLEYAGHAKGWMEGAPMIDTMGPKVRTHSRHFLQRCQYTVCVGMDEAPSGVKTARFAPHESVFAQGLPTQDLLWKIKLSSSLRPRVLAYLDRHNINAFSLFASEEGLMEACALREYVISERAS